MRSLIFIVIKIACIHRRFFKPSLQGFIQRMSGRWNCRDSACMERFFGTVKVESEYNDLEKALSFNETVFRSNETGKIQSNLVHKGLRLYEAATLSKVG